MRGNKNYYYSKIICKNIRKFKYLLGLNTEQFANRCGLTVERTRELEDGTNVATNGIDLLRIAEGCNIRYEDIFETDDDQNFVGFSVKFPPTLFKRLENYWIKKGKNRQWVAESIGGRADVISKWVHDKGYPRPILFANLIALFNLKACDLENILDDDSLLDKSEKKNKAKKKTIVIKADYTPLPEPKPELVESEESCKEELTNIAEKLDRETEEKPQPDEFETRMLKVMRLQKDIDSLMNQTKAIMSIAYDLYKALEKLK